MRHHQNFVIFLSVIFGSGLIVNVSAQCMMSYRNGTMCSGMICNGTERPLTNSSFNSILTCAGLGPVNLSQIPDGLIGRLKGFMDGAFDLYSYMRANAQPNHVINAVNMVCMNQSELNGLQDANFARVWFQVKLRPHLSTISRDFLTCLSRSNLTCQSYQALVEDFSLYSQNLGSMRQRMIYMSFMRPFLQRNSTNGCVEQGDSSDRWLLKNFGSFSTFANLRDFTALNGNFSGLAALNHLSSEQKAELLLLSEGLENTTITLVFQNLLQSLLGNEHLNQSGNASRPAVTGPQPQGFDANFSRFLMYLRPLADFVRAFLTVIQQTNVSSARLQTLTQALVNWTLAEFAGQFPNNVTLNNLTVTIQIPSSSTFNVTNIQDWFQNVIVPVLKRFLPNNQTQIPVDLTDAFNFFFPSNATTTTEPSVPVICSVDVNSSSCSVPQTSQDLAQALKCVAQANMSFSERNLQRLISELSKTLHTLIESNPSSAQRQITDLFGQLPANAFTMQNLADAEFISFWFQIKLRPLLPNVSRDLLSCLSTRHFSCPAYAALVEGMGNLSTVRQPGMPTQSLQTTLDRQKQELVYMAFILPFLSRNNSVDPGCVNSTRNDTEWIRRNFGPFLDFVPLEELLRLNRNLSVMDVLPVLSTRQLAELAARPGQLRSREDVKNIMRHVKSSELGAFFDIVYPTVEGNNLTAVVRAALLEEIIARANLSQPSVSDAEVNIWISRRLRPLVSHLNESYVTPLFSIVRNRSCNTSQQVVQLLDSVLGTLTNGTRRVIQQNILVSLKEPHPLRCYENNSFYQFLRASFLGFPLPKLTEFLSVIPPNRRSEVISSMAPSELGSYLRLPDVVDNDTQVCVIFNNYNRTTEFLDHVELPDNVRRPVLPCIWPLALKGDDQTEVNRWFDVRLGPYLKFLNKDLIRLVNTLNASCLPFQKLVSVLGANVTYNTSDFTREEVYTVIKTYLNTDSSTKCYNATDPQLNSTAWFANYIGVFITFVTLPDLYTFGPEKTLQLFAVNPQNIKLFALQGLPQTVTERYTELIYLQDPNFSPLLLPPIFQCSVPGSVYGQLSENQSITILGNLNQSCPSVNSDISAALAGNIQTINANTISALGQESVGLSTQQIASAPPSVIVNALQSLSSVSGWNQGQSIAIINVLLAGNFQLNSASNLLSLGSLIGGIPANTFTNIPPAQMLQAASNTAFINNLLTAPQVVQQSCVNQIIKVNQDPLVLMQNIPDSLTNQIPRNLLNFQTSGSSQIFIQNINKKKWKQEQAVLFFDTAANAFSDPDQLSVDVLQGFTCTRVQTFTKVKIRGLIKACRRRRNRAKVVLRETQLTCMYNQIRDENPQDFVNYPADMLLYYDYANVQQANCREYFNQTGHADFSIFSTTLDGRKAILLNGARNCLGITGTAINKNDLDILGNMCCTLDQDYIQNSDPEILEKMKNCNDFSSAQVTAMESVLLGGTTKYGPPDRWNDITLNNLGTLPLYFSGNFWGRFSRRDKRRFLRGFLKALRANKTERRKLRRLFKALTGSLRIRRAASDCTEGNITRITIGDDAFPFGYDASQFRHCLSAEVVKNNLADLTEKVDDDEFHRVILDKLKEAYPAGLSDEQVRLLGPVSRVATVDEISKWNVSSLDTLAALMDSNDGTWDADKSKAIVTKYLSGPNNTLGATELNFIGGPNLCSLDVDALNGISTESIRDANALDVSNCSSVQKRALFDIANRAFPISFTNRNSATYSYQLVQPYLGGATLFHVRGQSSANRASPISLTNRNSATLTSYQLMQPYLGGATLFYVRSLSSANISMDISTFTNLDESVLLNLTVSEVRGLLGINLPDLKTFENQTLVRAWISGQLQSELDTLGLNLTGGRVDVTVAPATNTNTTIANSTVASTTSSAPAVLLDFRRGVRSTLLLVLTAIAAQMLQLNTC